MTYTHLLFDLDHTLLDFDRAEDLALTYLLEEAGVASRDLKVYKDHYIPMPSHSRQGCVGGDRHR